MALLKCKLAVLLQCHRRTKQALPQPPTCCRVVLTFSTEPVTREASPLQLCILNTQMATASGGALTCATAPGVYFDSRDDLKAHYQTDWHRYNLKRKARGGPTSHLGAAAAPPAAAPAGGRR